MKITTLLLLSFSLVAEAAQIRKGKVAKGEGLADIVVSAEMNADLSSEYFGYFDFTLENKSDRWITVSRIKVLFPDSPQGEYIRFVSGNDFLEWRETMAKSLAIDDANKKSAQVIVGALGYGLAAFSGNRTLQAMGTAAYATAAGSYLSDKYSDWQDSLQRARMFPDNHLLGDTLRLLPGLFADRWLLVNSREHAKMGYVTRMLIELETTEGERGSYLLEFRTNWSYNWQKSLRPKGAPTPCPTGVSIAYREGC